MRKLIFFVFILSAFYGYSQNVFNPSSTAPDIDITGVYMIVPPSISIYTYIEFKDNQAIMMDSAHIVKASFYYRVLRYDSHWFVGISFTNYRASKTAEGITLTTISSDSEPQVIYLRSLK